MVKDSCDLMVDDSCGLLVEDSCGLMIKRCGLVEMNGCEVCDSVSSRLSVRPITQLISVELPEGSICVGYV